MAQLSHGRFTLFNAAIVLSLCLSCDPQKEAPANEGSTGTLCSREFDAIPNCNVDPQLVGAWQDNISIRYFYEDGTYDHTLEGASVVGAGRWCVSGKNIWFELENTLDNENHELYYAEYRISDRTLFGGIDDAFFKESGSGIEGTWSFQYGFCEKEWEDNAVDEFWSATVQIDYVIAGDTLEYSERFAGTDETKQESFEFNGTFKGTVHQVSEDELTITVTQADLTHLSEFQKKPLTAGETIPCCLYADGIILVCNQLRVSGFSCADNGMHSFHSSL